MVEGKHGVTANTAKAIVFGAGTIHKGLKYAGSSWNFESSLVGATVGGSKVTIKPEITSIDIDGALVPVKGLRVKTGETATMEINLTELTKDIIKSSVIGKDGTSTDATYTAIESKADIAEGDYWENIAFVGRTLEGKKIIVILDNALCTSGFESEGKNKEAGTRAFTFECNADVTGDLDVLPWKIYYPAS